MLGRADAWLCSVLCVRLLTVRLTRHRVLYAVPHPLLFQVPSSMGGRHHERAYITQELAHQRVTQQLEKGLYPVL